MNAQEWGKFVCYQDAIFLTPFYGGFGHDFTLYRVKPIKQTAKKTIRSVYIYTAGQAVHYGDLDHLRLETSNKFTIIVVCRLLNRNEGPYENGIVRKSSDWDDGFGLSFHRPNEIRNRCWFDDGTTSFGATLIKFKNNTFLNIVGQWTGDTAVNIVNNVIKKDHVGARTLASTVGLPFTIGNIGTRNRYCVGEIYYVGVWADVLPLNIYKSALHYANPHKKPKPTCVTRRGVYQAVKNTGIEVDGNMTNVAEVMC